MMIATATPAFTRESLVQLLLTAFAALTAIMLHEISHGFAAYKLGDPTARDSGRLSFNPLRHIDVVGLLMLIIVGFGWAKPVPVDTRYFKKPRRDMYLVALAGPLMNFLIALLSIVIVGFLMLASETNTFVALLIQYFLLLASINIGLGVFNLFPIPPLDGSRVWGLILPDGIYYKIMRYERVGMGVLMILLLLGVLDGPLTYLRNLVLSGLLQIGLQPAALLARLMGG